MKTLTVATTWPESERARAEESFKVKAGPGVRVRWVSLAAGDDPVRLVSRRLGPDVILGLPERTRNVTDARAILDQADWAAGYARLVRGEASPGSSRVERVALIGHTPRIPLAHEFVSSVLGESLANDRSFIDPDSLLDDLLGATLVDARPELDEARKTVEATGHPPRAERWLIEPPPWPPASVAKLLNQDENGMAMVNTLAAQVAPEADARSWLLRSWLAPNRAIDGAFLDEIAGAAGGKLAREPRFRAWLRGEWRAWARQRYRRVARLAIGKKVAS